MRTVDVIRKTKAFRDHWGNDIIDTSKLKTKRDCLEVLKHHHRWLEDANNDAIKGLDNFIRELGIEYEDLN